LKKLFQYVIIDTGSGLDEVTQTAIDEADILIMVTSQDIPSVKNVRLFLDLLIALGYPIEKVLAVLNMYDKRRTTVTPERIKDITKIEVAAALPMDDRLVQPAMDRGVPFLPANQTHPISKGIMSLAVKIKQKIAEIEAAEEAV
jgi:pilus assembly protein CpaE